MSRDDTLKTLRITLLRRRDALRKALEGDLSLLQELHNQKTGDALDAAADTVQDELNSQLVEVESRELLAIEEAIARFEEGRFGDCEDCGKSIPMNRLQVVPHARRCVRCQKASENSQLMAV